MPVKAKAMLDQKLSVSRFQTGNEDFQENWVARIVPARNFDKKQSVESMDRVARLLEDEHAKLWINHDKAQSASVAHAPAFLE